MGLSLDEQLAKTLVGDTLTAATKNTGISRVSDWVPITFRLNFVVDFQKVTFV